MNERQFDVEEFKKVIAELFEVDQHVLHNDYDLSNSIKDSIDLGELVAVLKSRYQVEPKDWESFKTETKLKGVFENFA